MPAARKSTRSASAESDQGTPHSGDEKRHAVTSAEEAAAVVRTLLERSSDELMGSIHEQSQRIQMQVSQNISKQVSMMFAEIGHLRAENEHLRAEASRLEINAIQSGGSVRTPNGPKLTPHVPPPMGNAKTLDYDPTTGGSTVTADSPPRKPAGRASMFRSSYQQETKPADGGSDIDLLEEPEGPADIVAAGPSPEKTTAKASPVFADASAMKAKIREAVSRKEYKVSDFYHETGICQSIACNNKFDSLTLFIILLNSLWIAYDTDNNDATILLYAEPLFIVVENLFCSYFSFEWIVRWAAFKKKRDGLRDAWFVFDGCLVAMMVLETWVTTAIVGMLVPSDGSGGAGLSGAGALKLVRLVRLTRMARMARLLRALPELIILIKGIVVASRSVFFTLVLLGIIMYVFAIVCRQLVGELSDPSAEVNLEEKYFDSVTFTMRSLLLYGVLPDMAEIVNDCLDQSVWLAILVLCFILLASLTVMNMLVGVLCEVVSVVSSVEKEALTVNYVKSRLMAMFNEVEADNDCMISKQEFDTLLVRPQAARIIQEIGVDVVGLVDFSDYIFKDGGQLSFPDFMELVLQLRGSNNSTVKDIVDLRSYVMRELTQIQTKVASMGGTMQRVVKALEGGESKMQPYVSGTPKALMVADLTKDSNSVINQVQSMGVPQSPPGGTSGQVPSPMYNNQGAVLYSAPHMPNRPAPTPQKEGSQLRLTAQVLRAASQHPPSRHGRPHSGRSRPVSAVSTRSASPGRLRAAAEPTLPRFSPNMWDAENITPEEEGAGSTGGTVGGRGVSTIGESRKPVHGVWAAW
eukprot:TRINITY_DN6504_c0_g1_i5.p1 TRINITY_DN6504_c0_g1~~TRINITY_DN6504_c0_g1_i5.p1  ORF type:complete len:807 (+),score=156.23 TRINITY_DN6504_c0_g1_i5:102-2522(+)